MHAWSVLQSVFVGLVDGRENNALSKYLILKRIYLTGRLLSQRTENNGAWCLRIWLARPRGIRENNSLPKSLKNNRFTAYAGLLSVPSENNEMGDVASNPCGLA